jgi:TonB-dependent receptor
MRKTLLAVVVSTFLLGALHRTAAQERKGTIIGHVLDATQAVVQGASVELQPGGQKSVTDYQGQFTFTGVTPGRYKITISALGFATFSNDDVAVTAGGVVAVDAALKVETHTEVVEVRAPREHGEVEALNRQRTADNILQVLPAEVITSLPNANIADAVGRLPSVTLERDEGEGKYIQIRGTEPRLTNVTIDGINVPSPESGVRQIKLDSMGSDLVESVEINKTLQANQDGDGIGGSVNLKTKTAGEAPTVIVYGLGGYTPIDNGRTVNQAGATLGQRFGSKKQFGFLIGGGFDYNARGINDIEPVPTPTSLTPHYDAMDQRDYIYYRNRWGMAGSSDYKLREGSDIYLRGLYTDFQDYGHKWVQTVTDGDLKNPNAAPPTISQDWRRPDFAIANLVLGGHHLFSTSWFNWDLSVSRARTLSGSGGANYVFNNADPATGLDTNCVNIPNPQTPFRPLFSAGCFSPGPGDVTDIRNYSLVAFALPGSGLTAQLNLQGSASYAKQYHLGSHYGTFEFGGKVRNGHKFDNTQQLTADFSGNPVPAGQFLGSFTDPNYYDKTYRFTNVTDYEKVRTFAENSGLIVASGLNGSNFSLIERVSAGYVMNTLDLTSRLRLVGGVRFEATHVSTLGFNNGTDSQGNTITPAVNVPGGSDYLDILPSVSLRIGVTQNLALRVAYSRGLARPNPQDIAQVNGTLDNTVKPNVVSLGNPNLKAEHSDNFDLLWEQYLNPVGSIQAGFFYKNLTDPIVNGTFVLSPSQFANSPLPVTSPFVKASQPLNVGSAHLLGFEVAYIQRLRFLPGVMKGAGISANYSYTTSQAQGLQGLLRNDTPALLRQAPNTWNISPTFDTKRFSMRMGITYNDTMIFSYQFKNLFVDPNQGVVPIPAATLAAASPLGAKGPNGDQYLYQHFQLDVQGSYKLGRGLSFYAYGLNLTNEPFGFYNGSPQYVVQREYYHPTYAGGLRWTLGKETH